MRIALGMTAYSQDLGLLSHNFNNNGFSKGCTNIKCCEELSLTTSLFGVLIVIVVDSWLGDAFILFSFPLYEITQTLQKIPHRLFLALRPILLTGLKNKRHTSFFSLSCYSVPLYRRPVLRSTLTP